MIDSMNFSLKIEKIVEKYTMSYLDAMVFYCDMNNMEIETAADLANEKIKNELKNEATDARLLKSSARENYNSLY